jgi:hypothetical protein
MRRDPSRALPFVAALAVALGAVPAHAEAGPPRVFMFTELSARPLFGIDRPFKGCAGDALAGIALSPFETGIRASGAYDAGLRAGELRFDFVLGLGSGLRAIVGCLLLFEEPALPNSAGADARLSATAADWPDRFGIAATMADIPWKPFGAALGIDAEIVYTAYRLKAKTALSGASAFAAGVEASLALRLRWETKKGN